MGCERCVHCNKEEKQMQLLGAVASAIGNQFESLVDFEIAWSASLAMPARILFQNKKTRARVAVVNLDLEFSQSLSGSLLESAFQRKEEKGYE